MGLHLPDHRDQGGLGRVGQLDAVRREVDLEAVRLLLVEAVGPEAGEALVHALGLLRGLVGAALGGRDAALEPLDLAADLVEALAHLVHPPLDRGDPVVHAALRAGTGS